MYHHETIRRYTGALLNLFEKVEVQYRSGTELKTTKIPIKYSLKEKYQLLDEVQESALNKNMNVLPLGYLKFEGLTRALDRHPNKHLKINTAKGDEEASWMYNNLPYDFAYEVGYLCRGMNEATQIVEQVATLFNPNHHVDVHDVRNLETPTRVPIQLTGIDFEPEEYEQFSSNLITVRFAIILVGHLYMPIKLTPRVKEFDMRLSVILDEKTAEASSLFEFNVGPDGIPY